MGICGTIFLFSFLFLVFFSFFSVNTCITFVRDQCLYVLQFRESAFGSRDREIVVDPPGKPSPSLWLYKVVKVQKQNLNHHFLPFHGSLIPLCHLS